MHFIPRIKVFLIKKKKSSHLPFDYFYCNIRRDNFFAVKRHSHKRYIKDKKKLALVSIHRLFFYAASTARFFPDNSCSICVVTHLRSTWCIWTANEVKSDARASTRPPITAVSLVLPRRHAPTTSGAEPREIAALNAPAHTETFIFNSHFGGLIKLKHRARCITHNGQSIKKGNTGKKKRTVENFIDSVNLQP